MQKTFKRTISFLLSIMLVVGVFAIVPFTASADTTSASYVKVTSEPESWAGDYLIVYEDEDGSTAFNGSSNELNSSGNYIDVTISGDKIASNAATNAAKVTIAQIDGGYSIATVGGTYIGGASGLNKMDSRSEAILNTISLENDSAQIVSNTSTLRFNTSWSGFRYYKTVSQQPVQLYKLTGGSAPTYTVTWKNGNEVLETDENVAAGALPSYDGEVPTKNADNEYFYKFAGWSDGETTYGLNDALPEVTANVTYTAVFDPDPRNIDLSFNANNSDIEWFNYCGGYGYWYIGAEADDYGAAFVGYSDQAEGTYTLDAMDAEGSYVFIEESNTSVSLTSASLTVAFNGATVTVSGTVAGEDGKTYDVAITAPATYSVFWMNGDEGIETDDDVAYGALPTYDGAVPAQDEDDEFTYEFAGWSDGETTYAANEIPAVTGDVTYTATFTAIPKAVEVTINEDGYYCENGEIVPNKGLVKIGDDYYYVIYNGKIKKNGDRTVTEEKANGLLPAGDYNFGPDGKMTNVPVMNGIDSDGYYRENSEIVKGKGLVQVDGDYYFVIYNGKIKKDGDRTVTEEFTNGLLPAGTYHFGADGKMTNVPLENGIDADGYYHENYQIIKDKGLVQVDGDYYYVIYNGKIKKDGDRTVQADKTNGLLPAGTYHFGADGKMTNVPVENGIDSEGYYRENYEIVKGKGLVQVDGDYYFVIYNGKIKKNGLRTVTAETSNELLPAGDYYFGADGKLVFPE